MSETKMDAKEKVLKVYSGAFLTEGDSDIWAIFSEEGEFAAILSESNTQIGAWEAAAARLSHPEIASHSNSPTCPLPLHNLLRLPDGTFKCSGCDRTWNEYPTVTAVWPKGSKR